MTTTLEWGRVIARGAAIAAVVGSIVGVSPSRALAQEFELGIAPAFFADLPEPFQDEYCETGAAGLAGSAAWRGFWWFLLEASAVVTGEFGGQTCAIADLAPIPPDTPILETTYPSGVEGLGFFATQASVVLEPLAGYAVSPRARIGAGWIWQKELFEWQWGLGLRYRFGSYALVTDVDRWNVSISELNETVIYRSGGGREVLASDTNDREYTPWVLRIGVEFAFPR